MGLVDIDMLRSGPVLKEKDTGDVSKFLNRLPKGADGMANNVDPNQTAPLGLHCLLMPV